MDSNNLATLTKSVQERWVGKAPPPQMSCWAASVVEVVEFVTKSIDTVCGLGEFIHRNQAADLKV